MMRTAVRRRADASTPPDLAYATACLFSRNNASRSAVDLVRDRGRAFRAERPVDLQRGALHDLRRQQRRSADRYDLIIVAVQNERRHIDLLEILGEVRFGEHFDAFVGALDACIPCSQNESRTPCDTVAPGRL